MEMAAMPMRIPRRGVILCEARLVKRVDNKAPFGIMAWCEHFLNGRFQEALFAVGSRRARIALALPIDDADVASMIAHAL
jgi:hypothetical protein